MLFSFTHLTNDQLDGLKFVLNLLFVVATAGVWLGVWLESERFPKFVQLIGWRLLVCCLGVETLFGALLWQSDSEISRRQEREISQLQARLAPRHIGKKEQSAIADVLRPFGPIPFDLCVTPGIEAEFLQDVEDTLALAGWAVKNSGFQNAPSALIDVPKGAKPGISVCSGRGIEVLVDPSHDAEFRKPANALVDALKGLGIAASTFVTEGGPRMRAEITHIHIGSRL